MSSKKHCGMCNIYKPRYSFHKDSGKKDGLATRCKSCTKEYDKKLHYSKPAIKEKYRQYNKKAYNLAKGLITWIKKSLPCKNCKKFYRKEVMEFDHIEMSKGNKTPIGRLTTFVEEIKKLRLLCSNCHAVRTAQQQEYIWRLSKAA